MIKSKPEWRRFSSYGGGGAAGGGGVAVLRSSTKGLPVLSFYQPKGPLEQWQGSVDKLQGLSAPWDPVRI